MNTADRRCHPSSAALLILAALSGAAVAEEPTSLAPRAVTPPLNACLAFRYPIIARKMEAEGATEVAFTVLPSGGVADVQVTQASGDTDAHRILDNAVRNGISRCVFAETPGFGPARAKQRVVWRMEPRAPEPAKPDVAQ